MQGSLGYVLDPPQHVWVLKVNLHQTANAALGLTQLEHQLEKIYEHSIRKQLPKSPAAPAGFFLFIFLVCDS